VVSEAPEPPVSTSFGLTTSSSFGFSKGLKINLLTVSVCSTLV